MRLRIIAVALLAGLALAGCGSSSKNSSGSSGGSSSSFCSKGESLQTKYKDADFSNKDQLTAAQADFQKLTDEAPSEIKSDMQTISDALKKGLDQGQAALQADEAKITASSDNISKYLKDKCGIDTNATSPTT